MNEIVNISAATEPMSILDLIRDASLLVQMVMLLLLLASFISWTMIFRKWLSFRQLEESADEFEDEFWSGGDLTAMRVALSREIDALETHLSFLATVGSTSPYIGLFGTVWGIMNSFRSLGTIQQVTIATVAPGIAEALIATAMGLFAAIPAVIAYNRFNNTSERLMTRYEIFMEEFLSIVNRQTFVSRNAGVPDR